ncbi:MAG: DUF177 domain-containing protein [Eudoraea sp.]|uniref:YceD family protein n=1 Tax=Eudoraea sp. TaxID=1979955 RepID=UPI003C76F0C7
MKNKEYCIPFAGLKQGKHKFEYQIDNTFFESFDYHEFNDAEIKLHIVLDRMSTVLELEMKTKGTVNLYCDLTNEPYDQKIKASLKLLVKFGAVYNDEDDEILIIPHGEHQVNISQYVYEMIILSVPSKRIHPGVLDGTLDSKALKRLEELQPKENKKDKNKIDPRWEALKKLLTDK